LNLRPRTAACTTQSTVAAMHSRNASQIPGSGMPRMEVVMVQDLPNYHVGGAWGFVVHFTPEEDRMACKTPKKAAKKPAPKKK